jgi:hypothetical protein
MNIESPQHIFEKHSNIKFHENPSSESRDGACGQMDMTKLIRAFRNFAEAPKIYCKVEKKLVTRSKFYLFTNSLVHQLVNNKTFIISRCAVRI